MAKLPDGPFFKFFPAKFMKGVRGLTPAEVGVYIMLLCRIYEEEGPIKNNPLILATYCEMRQPTFEKTLERLVALGKLTLSDGVLSNDKADDVISDRVVRSENAKTAGKASAGKRQENQRQSATGVPRPFNHKEEEKEQEYTPLPPEGGGQLDLLPEDRKPAKPRKVASQFPADWTPSEKLILWAVSEGMARERVLRCARHCVDHHRSRGNTYVDHDAAFRTWIRNDLDRFSAPSKSTTQAPAASEDSAFMRRLNQKIGSKP